jgi:hypothetical protein
MTQPAPNQRPRGGQPGNQNARKRWRYADLAGGASLGRRAMTIDGFTDEIALVRARIRTLLETNGPNSELFEALRILARLVSMHNRLTRLRP